MPTTKIETQDELNDFIESGDLADGAIVREVGGNTWMVYDTEDGPWAVRPLTEDDFHTVEGPHVPVLVQFEDFELPMYVTTQDFQNTVPGSTGGTR